MVEIARAEIIFNLNNRQMKILCLIENLSQGGAERQLIGLATMLANEGNKVKIVIYNNDFFYRPLLEGTGVVCEYVAKASNKLWRIPTLVKLIKKSKPDIVISFLRTPSVIACIAKLLLRNFRLIVSERNTTQKITFSERIRFFLFRYADKIVPNSYSQKDFIGIHYPNLKSKTVTITNFVDTNIFCPLEKEGVCQESDTLRIVSVGRVCQQKNVKLFIQAIKGAIDRGINLVVDWYGLATHPYLDECTQLTKSLGIEDKFIFHKETNDIRTAYYHADVMVLPSIYEGFPNVVCEAMSCGLPVLCSAICDNGYIVRDGVNGFLFNPHSVGDVVETIVKFSQMNAKERVMMGRRGREFALTDFSQKSFFEKYKEIIFE